jgi:hypothetical protein
MSAREKLEKNEKTIYKSLLQIFLFSHARLAYKIYTQFSQENRERFHFPKQHFILACSCDDSNVLVCSHKCGKINGSCFLEAHYTDR